MRKKQNYVKEVRDRVIWLTTAFCYPFLISCTVKS